MTARTQGYALLDSAGRVIGAFDAGLPLTLGAWKWIPRAHRMQPRRQRAVVAADTDIDCTPSFADSIRGYRRLSIR
jgi:hypothetical protein